MSADNWTIQTRARRGRKTPVVVTQPAATRQRTPTSNAFDALSETEVQASDTPARPRNLGGTLEQQLHTLHGDDSSQTTNTDNGSIPDEDHNEYDGSSDSSNTTEGITYTMGSSTDEKDERTPLVDTLTEIDPESCEEFKGQYTFANTRRFRIVLGTALEKHECVYMPGNNGYAWLIDTEETRQKRSGNPLIDPIDQDLLPVKPKEPKIGRNDTNDTKTWIYKDHERKYDRWKTYRHWNNEAITLLQNRFPECLEARKTEYGLPDNYTIREAMDYVEQWVGTDQELKIAHSATQDKQASRAYVHTEKGPIKFFHTLQRDKGDIDVLGQKLGIPPQTYIELTVKATNAIRKSCIPKDALRRINDSWELLLRTAQHKDMALWNAFVKHYTKEIKDLNRDGLDGLKQANHAMDLETAVSELQYANSVAQDDMLTAVHNAVRNEFANAHANSVGIPETVPTAPMSVAPTTLTGPSQYANNTVCLTREQFNELVQKSTASQPRAATPAKSRQPRPVRQFTKYCWTHGVNTSHDSKGCTNQEEGHKVDATYGNQMGGSGKNESKYGHYLHNRKVTKEYPL